MATTTTTLAQVNYLQPTSFKLIVKRQRFANLEFFAQSVDLPSVTVPASTLPFKRADAHMPGDKIQFSEFNIDIIADENLQAYQEVLEWMTQNVNNSFKPTTAITFDNEDTSTYDMTLSILSSHNNTTREVRFKSAFPISLGNLQMNASQTGNDIIVFPVTFMYSTFELT